MRYATAVRFGPPCPVLPDRAGPGDGRLLAELAGATPGELTRLVDEVQHRWISFVHG
jgi:hypothetical protein